VKPPPNGGLGIGLALVHELALAHGGRAEVESEGVGRGAEFSVWLPLVGSTAEAPPQKPPAEFDLGGWRVLAVDDYVDALTPFAEVLRLEGAVVDIADSAKKALALLEATSTTCWCPTWACRRWTATSSSPRCGSARPRAELHAIAMSGFGRRADARRALEAGFDAHLPKPASIEELKAAIARL
jgi:two-component system CheB/CheR fusion protein